MFFLHFYKMHIKPHVTEPLPLLASFAAHPLPCQHAAFLLNKNKK